ncbi:hypothetical protein ONZ45_g164 [Pleurotus djamor]|nr:hypothetical protein ONZ45_g164 [Pleurotus djamor]
MLTPSPPPIPAAGVLDAVKTVLSGVGKETGKVLDGTTAEDDVSTPPDDETIRPTDVQKPILSSTNPGDIVCHAGVPVCGSNNDLGIRYGHCYILSFADGSQLGAQRDNPTYAKGGYLQDVPFKVCQTTSHCSQGVVPRNGTFYLQDQVGRFDDPEGRLGWVDNGFGGTNMKFVVSPKKAGLFRGTPQCSRGGCSIKLQGGYTGQRGLSPTGPTANHGLTFRQNPRIGVTFRFIETSCANEYDPYF